MMLVMTRRESGEVDIEDAASLSFLGSSRGHG
jgi:hypothetical protein